MKFLNTQFSPVSCNSILLIPNISSALYSRTLSACDRLSMWECEGFWWNLLSTKKGIVEFMFWVTLFPNCRMNVSTATSYKRLCLLARVRRTTH
jgi:hypothetical protein